ncbi:hypothetical protein WA158_001199 [Blastocystis sp. Blastoise]
MSESQIVKKQVSKLNDLKFVDVKDMNQVHINSGDYYKIDYLLGVPRSKLQVVKIREFFQIINGSIFPVLISVVHDKSKKLKPINGVFDSDGDSVDNLIEFIVKNKYTDLMDTATLLSQLFAKSFPSEEDSEGESIVEPHISVDQQNALQKVIDELGNKIVMIPDILITNKVLLGSGSFGKAYKGNYKGQEVCVKYMKDEVSEEEMIYFYREVGFLTNCNCPYIVKGLGMTINANGRYGMVLEYANGGDVQQLLDKEGSLSEDQAFLIATQLAASVEYLHENNIIHRDLKPANIFLHNGQVKLGDLGLCKEAGNNAIKMTNVGTPVYMAPEIKISAVYSLKADIYSLGLIIYELFTNECLIGTIYRDEQAMRQVALGTYNYKLKESCPLNVRNLVKRCLVCDSHKRPDAKDIRKELEQMGSVHIESFAINNLKSLNSSLASINKYQKNSSYLGLNSKLSSNKSSNRSNNSSGSNSQSSSIHKPSTSFDGDLINDSIFITEDMIQFLEPYLSQTNLLSKIKLLYRSSKDGASAKNFHKYCDKKENTLIFIKQIDNKGNINIFGGYASEPWKNNINGRMYRFMEGIPIYDSKAFIFTLINSHNTKPRVFKCLQSSQALRYSKESGPQFGDTMIIGDQFSQDNAEQNHMNAFNMISHDYENDEKYFCSLFTNTGDQRNTNFFKVEDMEVFQFE